MIDLTSTGPNVFAQPLGTDFPQAVVDGLRARVCADAPEAMARVTLIVNTSRMARRINTLFAAAPAGFLPRVLLLTELDKLLAVPVAPSRAKLERHLQLAQLIAPVLERRKELGPKSAVFALSESLSALMDEMQGEGVTAQDIAALDVTDQSGHWQAAQALIGVAHDYVSALQNGRDSEARQRFLVQSLITQWDVSAPKSPIILAGSTGSRGTTALLMKAIARLPNGAVILPGFDTDMPRHVWSALAHPMTGEDHPQFRFASLLNELDIDPMNAKIWHDTVRISPARSKLVSLALRPAPVTDAWLSEGPRLPELSEVTKDITLMEAPTQRDEALAIALRLRKAAETGQTAALITPDRMLSRQVAAALDRWDIVPDDSAGAPLHLSAPGRFLRHSAELFMQPLDAELLLTLLKHPLTQSGTSMPAHGLYSQLLEEQLRRDRVPYPDAERLALLVAKASETIKAGDTMREWGTWLCASLPAEPDARLRPLNEWLADHKRLAELLCAGSAVGSGGLWDKNSGIAARAAFGSLEDNAHHAGDLSASDYAQLLQSILSGGEVRDRDESHPDIMIWGTLEARVQGADLVILGGLNDGVWPESVTADPWLNRQMRHNAGLLLPDRRIGLAAHDFQQAIAAPEVWLTRSTRLDDAETVPSRWINRLTNLMSGVASKNGPDALKQMKARGQVWIDTVAKLESVLPEPPAGRAAPLPPVDKRPRDFSVTEIKTLIRDPYAIYAKHCLKLRPLDPIVQEPDAPIRGIVVHEIMERFIKSVTQEGASLGVDQLLVVTDAVLDEHVPWPTARMLWCARMARAAPWIVETEAVRLASGQPAAMENTARAKLMLPEVGGSIRGVADRIDLTDQGSAIIYDYKSGSPPSPKQQKLFDKQLLIEAAMIENGAFEGLGPRTVIDAVYIGLGASPKEAAAPLDKETPADTLEGLKALIASYLQPDQPFVSRRMSEMDAHGGNYDHLARYGEWDDASLPAPEDLE
ncbi:MAG: double-strand break repair protein AddB [Aliishimia sp.]